MWGIVPYLHIMGLVDKIYVGDVYMTENKRQMTIHASQVGLANSVGLIFL